MDMSDYDQYKQKYEVICDEQGPLAAAQYIAQTEAPELSDPDTFFLDILKDAVEAMAHGEMESDYGVALAVVRVMTQVMPNTMDRDIVSKAICISLDKFDDFHLNQMLLFITAGSASVSPIQEALKLGSLLQSFDFKGFWTAYNAAEGHYKNAIRVEKLRETIVKVTSYSHSSITRTNIQQLLGAPSQECLDQLVKKFGWEEVTTNEGVVYNIDTEMLKLAGADGNDLPAPSPGDATEGATFEKYLKTLSA